MDTLKLALIPTRLRQYANTDFSDRTALPLGIVLILFIIFSVTYSLITPVFEAPDERDHFLYANWLADGHPIPHIIDDLKTVGHEIGQPPLYYALVASVIASIDRTDATSIVPANPYWRDGAGVNAHYHTDAERFPYQKSILAVHIGRLVSVFMGTGTIIATYYLARKIMPQTALWAAAMVAFNPQFVFLSGVLNNDNLIILLSTLTLLLLINILQASSPKKWRYLLLGGLWGASILTKLSGLALGAVIILGLSYSAWQKRSYKQATVGLWLVFLGLIIVSGWWFWRNWMVYGDPLAWKAMLVVNQGLLRTNLISWPEAVVASTFLRRSYWAMFGYGVLAVESFYWFVNGLMLLALIGLTVRLYRLRQNRHWQLFALHFGWVLIIYVALLRWIQQLSATEQGRLLFPAIASIAILLVWGLDRLPYRRWVMGISIAGLAVWTAVLPFTTILPAYAQPESLTASTPIPNPQAIMFGEQIQLRGYELPQSAVARGDSLEIDLYWQADRPIQESYAVAVHLLDAAGNVVSKLDTIPYNGRFSTAVWRVDETFRDRYTLPPLPETAVPGQGTILVTLYPWGQPEKALPITVYGQPIGNSIRLASYKIIPPPLYIEPPVETAVSFAQISDLTGYDAPSAATAGQTVPITLYWQAVQPDEKNYTVFIHFLDETGALVTQADGLPQNGRFPTSIWSSGEQIIDEHLLDLPPDLPAGIYQIAVGLYDAQNGQRVPAYQTIGSRWLNDVVILQTLIIEE